MVVNPDETVLGSMEKELKREGIDVKDPEKAAEAAEKAELKELNPQELKELEQSLQKPQDPNRHEFVVPMMPKKRMAPPNDEESRMPEAPAPGAAPQPPPLGYEQEPGFGYEEVDFGYEEPVPEEGPEPMPLMDQDLERADIRYDSKVDPQLERIADQVNAKIDLVEERLLGDRLQNLVVPFPASDASRDASSVRIFLSNPSSSTPDADTPLDQVNQLLQKADSIEKGLVATSNLQVQTMPSMATCAGIFALGQGYTMGRARRSARFL